MKKGLKKVKFNEMLILNERNIPIDEVKYKKNGNEL